MLATRWVVGVSDSESWLPFDETQPFDNASAALAWVEDYLRSHPDLFANHPSRGFTCKKMHGEAATLDDRTLALQPAVDQPLLDRSAATYFPHRDVLMELASLGA